MSIKNIFYTFSLLLICQFGFGQQSQTYIPQVPGVNVPFAGEKCASSYLHDEMMRNDPAYRLMRNQIFQQTQQFINAQSSRAGSPNRGVVYTIPIVFHVLHEGEALGDSTNIPDAQVMSCIAALNRDFRRNGDDGGISQTGPLGIDAEIEFCLARRDPNGNYTTGITRHDMSGVQGYLDSGVYHNAGAWRGDASMKAMVQWNPAQYLNVWVVNKINGLTNIYNGGGGGVIGYATFPGGSSSRDGVVLRFSATGNDITGIKGFNLWSATNDGKVLTHEMGHYFNLYHTFQSTSSCAMSTPCATSGDEVCDTPPTTVGMGNACASKPCPMDNVENYMQYQNGACASDFTPGQVARMRAVLVPGGARHSLTTNLNCSSPHNINPTLQAIIYPKDTVCSNTIPGYILVCNGGNDTLRTLTINYDIDGTGVIPYFWSGKIGPTECDTISLPARLTTTGPHTYNVAIDSNLINGNQTDGLPADNMLSSAFYSNPGFAVLINITTDCNGQEFSWALRDTSGAVKLTGSGYSQQAQNIFETACLDSGCYELEFYDAGGDGLQPKLFCPTAGSWEITDVTTGQRINKSVNPNFGDSVTFSFCLPYNTELTPGFTGCDTVYPGYPVFFNDTSRSFPAVYSWAWDFGDGTSSSLSSPIKKYAAVGTYNVKLVVQNAALIDSITKGGCVVVIPTPPGFCDTLDNYDLPLDSMIFYELLGTWGYYPGHNGANLAGYAEPFTLTGPSNTVQRMILPVVQADAGTPNSTFVMNVYSDNAGSPGAVLASDTILISSLVAGVSNEIYFTTPPFVTGTFWAGIELEYGNGDTLVITTANNRITTPVNTTFVKTAGIWQSSNTVASINTSTGIRVIFTDLPATGTINVSRERICQNQTTTFSAGGLANFDSLTWYFPGGLPNTSKNSSQTVSYTNAGVYKAILYLEGICSNDSIIKYITVDSAGATVNYTPTSTDICEQDSIRFDGTLTGTGTIYWTFPGGIPSVSNQEDDTVFFTVPGVYNLKMKVVNGCGSDSVSQQITVRGYPVTGISPGDTTLCVGSSLTMTGSGGSSYTWSTGGSTPSISVSPTVTTQYWAVGSNLNCSGDTAYINVTSNAIPNVIANATPDTLCLGSQVYFSMTGSNAITYDWDFGDLTTSSTPNQTHTYASPGLYVATLVGKFGLCDNTSTVNVLVNSCVGVDEVELANTVAMYPNPADDYLTIEFLSDATEELKLTILNNAGQQVYVGQLNKANQTERIDVSGFAEGIYLVRFSNENQVFTKKLVIVD